MLARDTVPCTEVSGWKLSPQCRKKYGLCGLISGSPPSPALGLTRTGNSLEDVLSGLQTKIFGFTGSLRHPALYWTEQKRRNHCMAPVPPSTPASLSTSPFSLGLRDQDPPKCPLLALVTISLHGTLESFPEVLTNIDKPFKSWAGLNLFNNSFGM